MSDDPLLEERYAPDQYGVLITCIFLNRTRASSARPYLHAFLQAYPTPRSLQGVQPLDIKRDYFQTLGFHRRAWTVVTLAQQLLHDPPRPGILRRKTYQNAGYPSEVAHLAGIGNYGSDAWRLFCKVDFYAGHDIAVEDEWDRVHPTDKDLRRYVQRRRREQVQQNIDQETDSMISQLGNLQIFREGVMIGEREHRMFVPQRIINGASNLQSVAT